MIIVFMFLLGYIKECFENGSLNEKEYLLLKDALDDSLNDIVKY